VKAYKRVHGPKLRINEPKNSRAVVEKGCVEAERALHGSQPALLVPRNLIPKKHIDRAHTGMNHSSEASIKDQAHKLQVVKYGCKQSEAHQSEHQAAPRTLIPSFPLLAALKQHSVLALPAAAFFTLCTSSPPASRNRRRRRREEKSSMDYRVSACQHEGFMLCQS
jgi:hypothetical protein